ncbi:uncharacterized protein [Eucyclogobius newberryi]|uniref:uncharacterized protein n=1 Tax=Eucyclogobius newberryi TaxID=166745 RepID=UPI003B591344
MATYTEENRHLTLLELNGRTDNDSLSKISANRPYTIPDYPRPEIHATRLSHSTDLPGLKGIKSDGGFRDPKNSGRVWFSLTVTPEDLRDAETRTMKRVRPGGIEEEAGGEVEEEEAGGEVEEEEAGGEVEEEEAGGEGQVEPGLLTKFASSPAFISSSRYGSYRLTFDLKDVLDRYKEQFCAGRAPVMRVWKTVLHKQEVMYVVLVHSPSDKRFSRHPLLVEQENSICAFRAEPEPHFLWRPQAMSNTHRFKLVQDDLLRASEVPKEFYVWDHVTLALVMDGPSQKDQVLRFPDNDLRQSLRFCEKGYPPVRPEIEFQSYDEANEEVQELWPGSGALKEFNKSPLHINN